MERLYDPDICRSVTDKYPDYFTFDVEEYFSNPMNYTAFKGENIGFAEYKNPGTYWVHFCYHTAKGKEAVNLAQDMLNALFRDCPAKIAIGLIEMGNRKARWVVRQAGFKSLGETETKNGMCEMFYWTKDN